MNKPRETFHFKPPNSLEGDWMIGLTDLEVYNSIFNITEHDNKFELFKFPDEKSGGVSYEKVRDEMEKDLKITDITATDLQDEILGSIFINEYREQVTKRMKDDKYVKILGFNVMSIFQAFESYLRTEIDLVEDDIKLLLDEYNSSFVTCELEPGMYTFTDLSEVIFKILQPECEGVNNTIDIEFDDITKKFKLVVRPGVLVIRFDEQSFFNTFLGFTPVWDYNSLYDYTGQKIVNLNIANKIQLK